MLLELVQRTQYKSPSSLTSDLQIGIFWIFHSRETFSVTEQRANITDLSGCVSIWLHCMRCNSCKNIGCNVKPCKMYFSVKLYLSVFVRDIRRKWEGKFFFRPKFAQPIRLDPLQTNFEKNIFFYFLVHPN